MRTFASLPSYYALIWTPPYVVGGLCERLAIGGKNRVGCGMNNFTLRLVGYLVQDDLNRELYQSPTRPFWAYVYTMSYTTACKGQHWGLVWIKGQNCP